MEKIIPNCYACGTPMVLREKDSSKFWGCPNWKTCGGKTIPYGKPERKPQPQRPAQPNPMMLILDEVRATNKRLDKMADYLLEKLK